MNKKIGKKMFILATVASIGTSFTVTSLDKASAAPVNDTEYMSQINTQTNATIIDWKNQSRKLCKGWARNLQQITLKGENF
ncbi:hypothetical protein P7H15_23330 [Paenibacillus larvae]|nr:hypothetical protein [Paenibacillus larvae]MDT2238967.1 hypothetical protein [Paenibacillus larvae]MDT2295150.1 hypothetical protein [Paenibacillus larvae]